MSDQKKVRRREHLFCLNYAKNGGNITDAGIKAGYSAVYMDKQGYLLLKKPHIQQEIARMREIVGQRADKSAIEVVNQISKQAFAEILDYVKPDPDRPGNFIGKHPDELTPDQRAAVKEFRVATIYREEMREGVKVKVVDRYEYRYELHDQALALIQMGRHFGIFDDKLKITNGSGNRFTNLTPEKLAELRAQIISYMSSASGDKPAIEGEFSESSQKMLLDDRGSGRSGGDTVGSGLRSEGRRRSAN